MISMAKAPGLASQIRLVDASGAETIIDSRGISVSVPGGRVFYSARRDGTHGGILFPFSMIAHDMVAHEVGLGQDRPNDGRGRLC